MTLIDPILSQGSIKVEEGGKEDQGDESWEGFYPLLLALKMEEEDWESGNL
jgi:hypothetical protein